MARDAFLGPERRRRGATVAHALVVPSLMTLVAACTSGKDDRPAFHGPTVDHALPGGQLPGDRCARPNTGCPCDTPGEIQECGEVRLRSEDSVLCSAGKRMCGEDGRWGECVGEHTFTRPMPAGGSRLQARSPAQACTPADPCNPACRAFEEDAEGLADPEDNLCIVSGGLGVCPRCGYLGPRSDQPTYELPGGWDEWEQRCSDDDDCVFDQRCVDDVCRPWGYPCHDATGETCGTVDLVAGPPCLEGTATYHVHVCNRGFTRADSGTLRIGLYSDSRRLHDCADPSYPEPDSGVIEFTLGPEPGRVLEPGRCVAIHPGNSTATGLDLSGPRGVLVNYDRNIPECLACNNWHVLDPDTECTRCRNLECRQDCPETTLSGVVRDPANVNPVPGVMVYVPNAELAAFPENVSCDTCEGIFSGSPITSTVTAADGSFTLTNVPSGVAFPLVMQIGRWRRQVTVPAIPRCESATLEPDLSRLPRTQRRCVGDTCTGEGDIPQMALVLSDAEPLQCVLRKMGIAESEFTTAAGDGRIHLYNHNGMTVPGGRQAFSGSDPLFSDPAALDRYSLVFAPCDGRHGYPPGGRTHSGPSYNGHPQPTANAEQRENVRNYLDRGGRLFASHWMSVDFVHLNYEAPRQPTTSDPGYDTPLDSPELDGWHYEDPSLYNPDAPVLHVFGENVERGGNTAETPDQHGGLPGPAGPSFVYTIDRTTALGRLFSDWATAADASPDGEGTLTFDSWAQHVLAVRSPAIRLAHGNSSTSPPNRAAEACVAPCPDREWGGEHTALFQFDTPWNVRPDAQCGRVVVAQSHVAEHPTCQILPDEDECQSTSPTDCSCLVLPADDATPDERAAAWEAACGPLGELTPAEKAFEFLVFSATQCVGVVAPPPLPGTLPWTSHDSEPYEADCKPGTRVEWRHFRWKAVVPEGTGIIFWAKTAPTLQGLATAPWVKIGSADETTTTWQTDAHTVDQHLHAHRPELRSERFLRVDYDFLTSGGATPTLTEWQQTFECVPIE